MVFAYKGLGFKSEPFAGADNRQWPHAKNFSSSGIFNSSCAVSHGVNPVRPSRHHLDSLFPKLDACIGAANRVSLDVRKLRLDGVGVSLLKSTRI